MFQSQPTVINVQRRHGALHGPLTVLLILWALALPAFLLLLTGLGPVGWILGLGATILLAIPWLAGGRDSVVPALHQLGPLLTATMTVFSELELEYLATQKLGRLAAVGADGAPFVTPVGFRYNSATDTIDIGGHGMLQSKKWRDVAGEPRVAFVVDDVLPPWQPRGRRGPRPRRPGDRDRDGVRARLRREP